MPVKIRLHKGVYVNMYTDAERVRFLEEFLVLRSKGLPGTRAAERVGVSYKALRRWEKGAEGARVSVKRALRDARDRERAMRDDKARKELVYIPLRADNQQELPLTRKRPTKWSLKLILPSGNTIHGSPEALAEVLHLMGGGK